MQGVESLRDVATALTSTHFITIPLFSRGLWTIKFVALPGADLSTTIYISPIFPKRTFAELKSKLWYFNNIKGERVDKIAKILETCDTDCRADTSKKEYFLFGKLADPAIQNRLFGRAGTPYTLPGYSAVETVNFLGDIICFNVKADQNSSVTGSMMELYGWESASMSRIGICENGMRYNALRIPSFHDID